MHKLSKTIVIIELFVQIFYCFAKKRNNLENVALPYTVIKGRPFILGLLQVI